MTDQRPVPEHGEPSADDTVTDGGSPAALLLSALETYHAVIQAHDPTTVISEVCRQLARCDGLGLVWVAEVAGGAQLVRCAASAGRGCEAVLPLTFPLEPHGSHSEPIAEAIRGGRAVVVAASDGGGLPPALGRLAASQGLASCAVVPMRTARTARGALVLHAARPDFFTHGVMEILQRLAEDLCPALDATVTPTPNSSATASTAPVEPPGAVLDSTPLAIVSLDLDGRVTAWNRTARELFGWTAEETIGYQIPLVPCERSEEFHALIRQAISGEVVHGVELPSCHRNGTTVDVALSAAPLREPGDRTVGAVITARPLSERQLLREQLRHAQKIEAIGRLAGGVAHDFNNLLQAMLSTTQLLRGNLSRPQRVADGLRELEEQARRGAQLTRQLLLFSRRESAKREQLELNAVVAETSRLLRRLLRENVEIVTRLSDSETPVRADRGQLEQVIVNLAVNGADAMDKGGRLEIATFVDHTGRVGFTVSDTGPGVPTELRERVFEPFFTTKPPNKGTGLGLSVVHGIVEAHGGEVEITDTASGGACFRVTLQRVGPGAHDGAADAEAPGGARDRRERKWRVLVVEDEVDAANALQEILRALGYEVVAVNRGQDAFDLPAQPEFDVLLTDYLLPDSVGDVVAAHLRQRWPGLAVVMMSGYTDDSDLRKAVSEGTLRFLQKPFDIAALDREIRAAIGVG
jgi:two-component system cell cycle sensor histidine kinase/response regulator CckA